MTDEHGNKLAAFIHAMLCEHFDSYVLVGFKINSVEGPYVASQVPDAKSAIALTTCLHSIAVLPPTAPGQCPKDV